MFLNNWQYNAIQRDYDLKKSHNKRILKEREEEIYTKIPAMKEMAGPLRIEFAQYKELAAFSQFGSDLNQDTLKRLNYGESIMEVLKQPQYKPVQVEDQVLILYALSNRYMADISIRHIRKFQRDLIVYVDKHAHYIKEEIRKTGKLSEKLNKGIEAAIAEVKKEYDYS